MLYELTEPTLAEKQMQMCTAFETDTVTAEESRLENGLLPNQPLIMYPEALAPLNQEW
jgi:hypothetical protein